MRGNRDATLRESTGQGSIPAHAGKPVQPHGIWAQVGVYPRACGETRTQPLLTGTWKGLSPRMRGNLELIQTLHPEVRSIPAHAGKPPHGCGRTRDNRVYPRACGETVGAGTTISARGGLSPRMRGNPDATGIDPPGARSIPAHAGKPYAGLARRSNKRVYPRACGETHGEVWPILDG